LVLLHGRAAAREMVEPEAEPLVRIASEVLGDDKGRSGYSYSGLCLTSLPHRKLPTEQAWERTVGPLTLIIEPGRIKIGSNPSKLLGVPYGARARLILIYLQTQAVLTGSREVSLGRSMREWMGRMGLSVGGSVSGYPVLSPSPVRGKCWRRFTSSTQRRTVIPSYGMTVRLLDGSTVIQFMELGGACQSLCRPYRPTLQ